MIKKTIRNNKELEFFYQNIKGFYPLSNNKSSIFLEIIKAVANEVKDINWKEVSNAEIDTYNNFDQEDRPSNITIYLEGKDIESITDSIKEQLNVQRPKFSAILKLILKFAYLKHQHMLNQPQVNIIIQISSLSLIDKLITVLKMKENDAKNKVILEIDKLMSNYLKDNEECLLLDKKSYGFWDNPTDAIYDKLNEEQDDEDK